MTGLNSKLGWILKILRNGPMIWPGKKISLDSPENTGTLWGGEK
jgi:hypothetical protein